MHGADFSDRLLSLAVDGELLATRVLSLAPRRGAAGAPDFAARLAVLREQLGAQRDVPLWAAVGSRTSAAELGELLRQARAASLAVQGFVDAAVAAAAWLGMPEQSIVIDVGQNSTVFGVVANDGRETRLRRTAVVPVGEAGLLESWLRLMAGTMVRQTRYDPLHEMQQELRLRARVRDAAIEAGRDGGTRLAFDADGRALELTLSRDQFVTAAEEWFKPFAQMLQALCAGVGECQVLAPAPLLALPGAAEAFAVAGTRPVWGVEDGVAAQAASLLPAAQAAGSGAVRYLTQLPAYAAPAPAGRCARVAARAGAEQAAATHLVWRGRAIPIDDAGIVLGRNPGEGPQALQLPEGIAGLSRRHCTLRRAGAETVLVDHSRFGTFVDGQRVNGRALLAAGHTLRLGSPGIELPLIAIP